MRTVILTTILASAFATSAYGKHELTFGDVKSLAMEAVRNCQFEYDVPRLRMDTVKRQAGWDWGKFDFPSKRPIDYVVGFQARIEVFRRGYRRSYTKKWESIAAQSERLTKGPMLRLVYDPQLEDAEKIDRILDLERSDRELYESALKQWAIKNDWTYVTYGQAAAEFAITIVSQPRGAQIKLAHIVRWRVALLEQIDPKTTMDNLVDGSMYAWNGEHVIMAIFPDGRVLQPTKRTVGGAGTLTVYPTRLVFHPVP